MVNIQSSSFSSVEHLRCVINVVFAPEPWLRWEAQNLGRGMPKSINVTLGLYRQRIHPTGTPEGDDGWWEVFDATSATTAVADMVVRLEDSGWEVLDDMFSREVLMSRLLTGDLGMIQRSGCSVLSARAAALMLMDAGPSAAVDEHLDLLWPT